LRNSRSAGSRAMAKWSLRFPVWRRAVGEEEANEWILPLKIRTADGSMAPLPFLFDTGSHFTTIPLPEAEHRGIPVDRRRPVTIRGATGFGQGFLAPMWFSLAGLPEFQFESLCCFSDSPRALLALKDVITHFKLRTLVPSKLHPLGSLILELRGRHKGQPRPA